jgi:hypothetical protein
MIRQIVGAAIAMTGMGLSACDAQTTPATPPSQATQPTVPFEPVAAPAKTESSKPPPSKKESSQAPLKPVPAESRTQEDATARAADRKDPSGALIIEKPGAAGAKP